MPELLLDENHIYHLDGRQIDGLTSTIAEAGLMGNFGTEWHMTKGTAVHLATELWDKGTLDESTVDPQIQGSLESWKRFRKDQNYTPIGIERKFFNSVLLVGMMIDRLPGPCDLKSGSPEPWHILQISLHWSTLIGLGLKDMAKSPMDIYLDPDGGSPKVKLYSYSELKEAYQVYCSMLHFIRWRRSVGIKNDNR
jgi:hypothetical protein